MKKRSGDGWSFVPANDGDDAGGEPTTSRDPESHRLRIRIEKRAKGKTVTTISPLELTPEDMAALLKQLKKACGSGGTSKDGAIELQGDCVERTRRWLGERGWGLR